MAYGLGLGEYDAQLICSANDRTKANVKRYAKDAGIDEAVIARGAVRRSKMNFRWSAGAGLFLVDYDFKPGQYSPETRQKAQEFDDLVNENGLKAALSMAVGYDLSGYETLEVPSSSNGIVGPNGEKVDSKGRHLYFVMEDAQQAPKWRDHFWTTMIANGWVWVQLAMNGKGLIRTGLDSTVISPERLIYEAPPVLDANGIRRLKHQIDDVVEELIATADRLDEALVAHDKQTDKFERKMTLITANIEYVALKNDLYHDERYAYDNAVTRSVRQRLQRGHIETCGGRGMKNEALLKAVAKLVAREVSRLEEKLLNGASPVEQQASLVADSILDDMRQFNNSVPVFDAGTKTPNPVVTLKWLKPKD